jgi:photosystem II stability/assembly factor-like uncharacterized protein
MRLVGPKVARAAPFMAVSAPLLLLLQHSSPPEFSKHDLIQRPPALVRISDTASPSAPDPSPTPTTPATPTSSAPPSQQAPGVIILQGDIALRPNKSFKFTAGVWGTSNGEVTWSVQEMTAGGSISASGVYTAPSASAVYHVVATSAALAKSDVVTVTVIDRIPWQNITPPISLDFNNPPNNYGTQIILSSPSQPTTLYVGTNYQGVWKSINSGKTWFKANVGLSSGPGSIYFNNDGSPAGRGEGCAGIEARNWAMAIDPIDANVVYTAAGYGCAQGLWKSTNGGATWRQMFAQAVMKQSTNDIGSIEIDPADHLHILVGSHSAWTGTPGAAGVWESRDGGKIWALHPLSQAAGSSNHFASFLDARTWIVITQDAGIWRSADAGVTWNKVSAFTKAHGGSSLYRAKTGEFYLGGNNRILRSADFGATWSDAGAPTNQDGYMGLVGDGTFIYTASANTGTSTLGPVRYYYTPESDGSNWKLYNSQTFSDGPMSMTFDAQNGVVFSSNWNGGVWKLVAGN